MRRWWLVAGVVLCACSVEERPAEFPPTCGSDLLASGNLFTSGGVGTSLTFSNRPADADVTHKIDVDPNEDGCTSSLRLAFDVADQGCHVDLAFAVGGDPSRFLVQKLTITADSFCPGWADQDEGVYAMGGVPTGEFTFAPRVDQRAADTACVRTTMQADIYSVLCRDGERHPLNLIGLSVTGGFPSVGATDESCPEDPPTSSALDDDPDPVCE